MSSVTQRRKFGLLELFLATFVCAIFLANWRGAELRSIAPQMIFLFAAIGIFVCAEKLAPAPAWAITIGAVLGLVASATVLATYIAMHHRSPSTSQLATFVARTCLPG